MGKAGTEVACPMNRIPTRAFRSLVAAWLAAGGVAAQAPAPLILELPASTEAMGLGNVFPVSGRDADGLFYNPATLDRASGVGVAVQRFGSRSTILTGSGALPWLGGGIGVGVQALAYDAGEGGVPTENDLVSDGDVAVSEMAASVGYAREVSGLRLGMAGKVLEQRIGRANASTVAIDLGVTADVAFLTLGLAVQNLGPDLGLGEVELELPDRIALAGSFEPEPLGPLDVRAAAAVSRRGDGEIIPAGGVDIRYWPVQGRTFIVRIGARRVPDSPADPLAFGLAFWGDAIAVEYAFQSYTGTEDAHRIGLRWRQ